MTFSLTGLAPVGNQSRRISGVGTDDLSGAPQVWSYATADTIATVNTAGYFNAAYSMLEIGDLIYVLSGAGNGGTLVASLVYVKDKGSGVLDVTDGLTITATDTD